MLSDSAQTRAEFGSFAIRFEWISEMPEVFENALSRLLGIES